MTDGLEAAREDQWAAARRVVSDDHPTDCPCIRDHLEVSFIHGMGYTTERTSESALRAAAQELVYGENFGQHVGDCKIDHVRDAECTCYLAPLKAALDGAPWEPSEEQVERVAIAVWRAGVNEGISDKPPPEQWVPPFTWESVHPHSKEVKYYPVARAALKAALGLESGSAG